MNHVAPNTGYAPEKTKKQQAQHTKPTQKQQQQPSNQPQQ
jgi:hypothetical protein